MKFDPEKMEHFAEGAEKIVYHHPQDPEKVVAEFRSDAIEAREMKGRFYLTKVLHALFPRNIPDISLAAKEGGSNPYMVLEKKHLDRQHEELRDLSTHQQMKSHQGESDREIDDAILDKELASMESLNRDPDIEALSKTMREAGLEMLLDTSPRNFGRDQEGNLVYVDNSFYPWWAGEDGSIEPRDYHVLREAIQKIDDKEARDRAMAYLERLETLRAEAEQEAERNSQEGHTTK